jgi:DNA-binding LacI/PurR family transcriptional regulator
LIISLPPTDQQAARFANSEIPTVLVDAFHPDLCCIVTDDLTGGRMVTEHLIKLGHRKIAFLGDFLETPFHPSMRYRFQGYQEALYEAGIPFSPDYHIEGPNDRSSAREMARHLLSLDDPPTAIFAGCDTQAIGVLDTAREMDIGIPAELSVIGYDGIRDAEYLKLTTLEQHLFDSGIEGVELLFQALEQKAEVPCRKYVPIELVIRETAGLPPQRD